MAAREVWSIDPGAKRIGFARWWENGSLIAKAVMTEQGLFEHLERYLDYTHADVAAPLPPKVIVIEKWAFRPGQTGRGDKMLSSQAIGAIRFFAHVVGAEVVEQDSSILRVTALHSGTKVPAGHIPDDVSAYLHGFYYFESKGILKARAIW